MNRSTYFPGDVDIEGTLTVGGGTVTGGGGGGGATVPTAVALGDLIYASAASTWARLAGQITTTRKFLAQTGDGTASAAPAWLALVAADIPALDAAKITSGTIAQARLGSGSGGAGDKFLADDQTYKTVTAAPAFSGARVYNSAAISTTNGTVAFLTFNSERFDTDAYHDLVTNTDRLTIPVSGKYMVGASVEFNTNASGYRLLYLELNGTDVIVADRRPPVSGSLTDVHVSTLWQFAAGDYVRVAAFQTSGGALNVQAQAKYSPEFWITFLG